MSGWIYILEHQSGTTVKVGQTRVSPKSRSQNYSSVYDLKGFHLASYFEVPTEARKDIEKIAHQKLSEYQISGLEGAREIFSCSLTQATKAIEEAIKESRVHKELEIKRIQKEKLKKEKERIEKEAYNKVILEWEKSKEFRLVEDKIREFSKPKIQDGNPTNFLITLGIIAALLFPVVLYHQTNDSSVFKIYWVYVFGFMCLFLYHAANFDKPIKASESEKKLIKDINSIKEKWLLDNYPHANSDGKYTYLMLPDSRGKNDYY